ncbi:unnamed protein product [Paramecium sonneborni]|uniref:Transmembrane protein n=1 Tax=Paramecium sonneborni TaxID=65129 RepID=A0A8S1QH14_9CILI|nr:unnamed protein product [Paramecium sonneborni]
MIMGGLSYLKINPIIYFYNRDESIRQFSFSEINKYLQLSGEDKFRNPCILFKERTKSVIMVRDLIFHRVALFSMMITMTIQTIPQLFIQGFYNTQIGLWDAFNVFSFLFQYLTQSITFSNNNLLYSLQPIDQCKQNYNLSQKKSNQNSFKKQNNCQNLIKNIWDLWNHFISILIQVDSPLIKKKDFEYLANRLKQKEQVFYTMIKIAQDFCRIYFRIFQTQFLNFNITKILIFYGILKYWILMQKRRKYKGYHLLKSKNNCWLVSRQFRGGNRLIVIQQQYQKLAETSQEIIEEAMIEINTIIKKTLFQQTVRNIKFFLTLYDYYQTWNKLNWFQFKYQNYLVIVKFSIIYLSEENDMFIIHQQFQLQLIQFYRWCHLQYFKKYSKHLMSQVFLFGIFNFFKVWDIVMICLFLLLDRFRQVVKESLVLLHTQSSKIMPQNLRQLSHLGIQFNMVAIDMKNFLEIINQPFYQAVVWRTNVEEALNKIPQFFVYILSLSSKEVTGTWVISFIQQMKETLIFEHSFSGLIFLINFVFKLNIKLNSIGISQILLNCFNSQGKVFKRKIYFQNQAKNINFFQLCRLKKKSFQLNLDMFLLQQQSILEIDQAQRLFFMGPGLNDLIRCLKVIDPAHIPHINAILSNSPQKLQFLQLQIESTIVQSMQIVVERQSFLKAFSFSYYQITPQHNNRAAIAQQTNFNVDEQFLRLDRYDFDQFYFEVSVLQVEIFQGIYFKQCNPQIFQFQTNLISTQLKTLDITFENIYLDFQQYYFQNLTGLKMILKRCLFVKNELKRLLYSLNNSTIYVHIDMSLQGLQAFTPSEQKDLVERLERQQNDVFIKI